MAALTFLDDEHSVQAKGHANCALFRRTTKQSIFVLPMMKFATKKMRDASFFRLELRRARNFRRSK